MSEEQQPQAEHFIRARASKMTAREDLLAIARQRATDPSVFDELEPVFLRAEISNDQLDSYATRMASSTLKNFRDAAEAGVSFLRNHQVTQDAIGRTLHAIYEDGRSGHGRRTLAEMFVLPTDDAKSYIQKLRGGVVTDVSVGFSDGRWQCDLCGREVTDHWTRLIADGDDYCQHILGWWYDDKEHVTRDGNGRQATAEIHDGILREVSGVFEGATPNAGFIGMAREVKAYNMALRGMFTPQERQLITVRHRMALPDAQPKMRFSGHSLNNTPIGEIVPSTETMVDLGSPVSIGNAKLPYKELWIGNSGGRGVILEPDGSFTLNRSGTLNGSREEPRMSTVEIPRELCDRVRQLLPESDRATAEGQGQIEALLRHMEHQMGEVRRLSPLAEMGRQRREMLVTQILNDGYTAQGDAWNKEAMRGVFESLTDMQALEAQAAYYRKQAESALPEGRATNETAQTPPQPGPQPVPPQPGPGPQPGPQPVPPQPPPQPQPVGERQPVPLAAFRIRR